jgi:hypothetical protein
VNLNELGRALDETRVLRLALNVLYDGLPDDVTRVPVEDALVKVHDHLTESESRALTQWGFAEHYVVIRPFSPVRLPDEGGMRELLVNILHGEPEKNVHIKRRTEDEIQRLLREEFTPARAAPESATRPKRDTSVAGASWPAVVAGAL